MKVNNVNRFQVNPVDTDQPRSRLGRSYSRTQTFLTGKLVPIYVKEVLPNETLKLDFSSLVRAITPAVPTMDNAFIDYFFFFVPNRLCTYGHDDWQKICGENKSGYWAPNSETTLVSSGNSLNIRDLTQETINNVSYRIAPQSLLNYLGAPVLPSSRVNQDSTNTSGVINTLACFAYYRIWDEWFRDENTQSPVYGTLVKANFGKTTSILSVNKFHDIYTSALQSPQKGQSVMLPLGTSAPVLTALNPHSVNTNPLTFSKKNGTSTFSNGFNLGVSSSSASGTDAALMAYTTSNEAPSSALGRMAEYDGDNTSAISDAGFVIPNNLYTDLSQATAATVNELRNAFAIQRLLEKDARGGTRYFETLLAHFGVTNPDLVLQRPEYLAGKRVPLNISQVLQTSGDMTGALSPLGSTGAFSNTATSDYMFTKSFGEFGFVMGLACVRTSQSYSQGIPKFMLRNRRFDFYWRSLANIGEQPLLKKELYFGTDASKNDAVFGYQEAWADYRYQYNQVLGFVAPDAGDTSLTAWTYTNKFTDYPTLNSDFNVQSPVNFDQTLAVSNSPYHFIANFYFDERLDLPMPLYSIPGLIDHH